MDRLERFFADEQLLVKLLTWPEAHVAYLHVTLWIVIVANAHSRQVDHVLGRLGDLHGLSHVEDEDFTFSRHRARLEHQLRGFGNGHEKSGNFLVGNSDRPARADLAAESLNHRTGGIKDIAEAY